MLRSKSVSFAPNLEKCIVSERKNLEKVKKEHRSQVQLLKSLLYKQKRLTNVKKQLKNVIH
ncbi:unnamed protein product [Callosobruchus maculatus]|uniref:Uncharacterized protein n=1 Tax=Callosobruchus maculatus TaxID=64391 RepID=A0A653D1W1_CALMS|nr:unnamed protein product [Callosobruchus maculatus]